jgi:NAD(P)-dependent dehydrogenase (short-subunit alcohol dehydrogenase family)
MDSPDGIASVLDLRKKVAVVTGSAQGIGKNIARKLGKYGATIILCDKDVAQGETTRLELTDMGIDCAWFHMDLSKQSEILRLTEYIHGKYGCIDILVNNARSGRRVKVEDEDEDSWDHCMAVSLKAAFFTSKLLIKKNLIHEGGSIVNISSVAGALVSNTEAPSYQIAKAGMIQMTRNLALYGGCFGIRVNTILPGFIVKDIHQERFWGDDNRSYREAAIFCHPLKKVGRADDIADGVLFFASPMSAFITGQCLVIDGGLTIQEQSTLVMQFTNAFNKR